MITVSLDRSVKTWTLQKALNWGFEFLSRTYLESPEVDAKVLLSELLGFSPSQLFLKLQDPINHETLRAYQGMIKRRSQFEPVAYIVGKKNFMGFDFLVDRRVLIPRPETELMVEAAIQYMEKAKLQNARILDMGTGSGCIAVSIARHSSSSQITAVDQSKDALEVATRNAMTAGVRDQIQFVQNDLFDGFSQEYLNHFDIIISNPPYISTSDWGDLSPDIFYEPRQALVGGIDGLYFINRIIKQGFSFLKARGVLFLEMGIHQASSVKEMMGKQSYIHIVTKKDYSNIERFIYGVKKA